MNSADNTIEVEFAAMRISRSATIMLNGCIQDIFPLFTPFREKDWAAGWQPEIVYGDDLIKEGLMFRTPSSFDDDQHYLWIISKYEEQHFLIQYAVIAPERLWFIEVHCKPHRTNTLATVTYVYTGLTEKGHQRNKIALNKMFADNLMDWENAINYYLKTGKKLHH